MKRIILLIVILATALSEVLAARMYPAKGRIVNEQGEAVEYASVVLLKEDRQVAGMASDDEGRFVLDVAPGDYTLSVQYIGFDPVRCDVRITGENDLGDIILKSSATAIEGVVVKAQLIRREADRFVVDVANAPAAIGKDGVELLEQAPGIWIDGEKITINGKSGSKVYVNDRELRMEPEQLLVYLRGLRAEEIQKIEVVPLTGADYDADSSGGVIRITLRSRRENGLQGSVSVNTQQSGLANMWSPGGNIAYHSGRFDLNASGWSYLGNQLNETYEQTRYTGRNQSLGSDSRMDNDMYMGGATVGAIYEIDDRNSVGAEFSYFHSGDESTNGSSTDFTADGATTHTRSTFGAWSRANGYEATLNYIRKIDTLGSTFKVLGDYAHRRTDSRNDNISSITHPGAQIPVDSLFRDRMASSYDVAALTLALDKHFSARWALKAGAKYTRNEMNNDALYEYRKEGAWTKNDDQSFVVGYTEHIAALYGVATFNSGRWSAVAGLRGEYTHTYGRGRVGQDYFSLFPNANLSYRITQDGAYSLIGQYARTIQRPGFWALTPQRTQISDYSYQIGNPRLDPAFKDDVSLTLVLKHKYTITGGIMFQRQEINQTIRADEENPDMLGIHWVNYDDTKSYYVSANLPLQPAKWWQLNLNGTYVRRGERLDQHAPERRSNLVHLNASTTFTLPANFFIDLSWYFQSRVRFGEVSVKSNHWLNAGVKKRFGDRFVLSFTARNLLDRPQVVDARGQGFVRTMRMDQMWCKRSYQVRLTWNFKSGKAFQRKSVEAAAADDKGRMGGNK